MKIFFRYLALGLSEYSKNYSFHLARKWIKELHRSGIIADYDKDILERVQEKEGRIPWIVLVLDYLEEIDIMDYYKPKLSTSEGGISDKLDQKVLKFSKMANLKNKPITDLKDGKFTIKYDGKKYRRNFESYKSLDSSATVPIHYPPLVEFFNEILTDIGSTKRLYLVNQDLGSMAIDPNHKEKIEDFLMIELELPGKEGNNTNNR